MVAGTRLTGAAAAVLVGAWTGAAAGAARPHVLLILVDDLGWNNLGFKRERLEGPEQQEALTPTIDRLVRSGIELNRAYVYNFCSPSRSSLQSGRLPVHVSTTDADPTSYNVSDASSGFAGIPRPMTGVAEKMRQAGYRTHMTGKWDCGMATPEHTPSGRGYESWIGYFHHANDYYDETLSGGSTVVTDVCGRELGLNLVDLWSSGPAGSGPSRLNGTQYEEYLFTDNSVKVIHEHDASNTAAPLFLVHAFHTVHTPLQIPEERTKHFTFLENKDRRKYASMVAYMDSAIGQFVSALEKKGMWENTLVIMSSDNGGPIYGTPGSPTDLKTATFGAANNLPLRGGKTSDWEGGIRVNAFVAGGAVPLGMRGTALDDYIHIADWYATLCAIAGVDAFDERAAAKNLPAVDSINMWPLLSGKVAPGHGPRREIHISRKTLIQGNYKLLTGSDNAILKFHHEDLMTFDCHGVGWGPEAVAHTLKPGRNCSRGCLFDIMADPNEDHQIKDKPEVVAQMMQRLQELNKSNFNPGRGAQNKLACEVAVNKYGGFYGPFINVGYAEGDARSHEEHMANSVAEIAFADAAFTTLVRS